MKNIRNESGYPINVPSNVPAPVEADDHRHSSPCYIHNGECINPYHIHAEEAEKEHSRDEVDEILDKLTARGTVHIGHGEAKELLLAWRDKAVVVARIDELEHLPDGSRWIDEKTGQNIWATDRIAQLNGANTTFNMPVGELPDLSQLGAKDEPKA